MMIESDLDHYFIPKIAHNLVYLDQPTFYPYCLNKFRNALFSIGISNFMDYGEHSDKIGGLSAAANAGCDTYALQVHGRLKYDNIPNINKKIISFKNCVSL